MKRKWLVLAVAVLLLSLIGLIVKTKFLSKESPGALQVSSTPRAVVFLDDAQVGTTPYFDDNITAGEHNVKLVPENEADELPSWQTRVEVTANIITVVKRDLAAEESSSSGEILSLEKIGDRGRSELAIVSVPDHTVVKVNGEPKGFTPVLIKDLPPGDYQVTVASTGYQERVVSANTVAGYKLTADVKLAQQIEGIEEGGEAEPAETEEGEGTGTDEKAEEDKEKADLSPTPTPTSKKTAGPTPTPPDKPYVKIKETPTGWLRVRAKASTASEELTKVDVGQMIPFLEEEENGWYKIEYKEGEEGWISSVYAELVE